MNKPSIRYFGGKTRLRKWLRDKFPQTGGIFGECFAGVGNVYYEVCDLKFEKFWLNDTNPFLSDLKGVDVDSIPLELSREDFKKYKSENSAISRVIEPECTFSGKGYKHGYFVRNFSRVRPRLTKAKQLLQNATVTTLSWEQIDWEEFQEEDFWYLDPPYFGTETPYEQIDHPALLKMLNGAKFKWAISSYINPLYEDTLEYKNQYFITKNADLKGANARKKMDLVETLYTNY